MGRVFDGSGVTCETLDRTGRNTPRNRFGEKAVNARMNRSPKVHWLTARCRSKAIR